MMCHVGLHDGVRLSGRHARFGAVKRFVKPKTPEHVQFLQLNHILPYRLRLQRESNQRGIGGNDQIVGQITFVAEGGNTKSTVLVVQVDVKGKVT